MKRSWIKRKYKPDPIPPEITQALLERSGNRCEIKFDETHRCHISYGLERHHIIPRSKMGKHDLLNLRLICQRCHYLVHNGTIEMYPWIKAYKGRYIKK